MCLIVNSSKKIAETDLVVYKILKKEKKDNFLTPYRKCPIQFENGQFFQVMDGEKVLDLDFIYIKKGIHAYYREKAAKAKFAEISKIKKILKGDLSFFHFKVHYAIIPKGCEYYLGYYNEIVSTEMIIFRTREDYRKYKREHKVKSIKY